MFQQQMLFAAAEAVKQSGTFPLSSSTAVLAALGAICGFFFWLEKATRWRFFQFVPPLIFIYLVPIILSTAGILPTESPVYSGMQTFLLPMLLVLLLLKMNVRGAVRILGRGLGVMLFGTLGVMVGAPLGLLAVKHWLQPDAWKAFGALSASWIGGTANMTAVASMLNTNGVESLSMLADSTITYVIWLPLLLASKRFADRFARFTGVDKFQADRMEQDAEIPEERTAAPTTQDYLFLLAAALIATWVADVGATWIESMSAGPDGASTEISPFVAASTWRILLITTIGIALSFTPLSQLSGSQEFAMALLYLYVARMGATADLARVADQAVPFMIGATIWIFIHGIFCLIGAKIFRTDIHTAAIASAANIGGVASASIVASYHKRSLLPAAILMAIIGYAIGNYCGIFTAWVCRLVMQAPS